MTIQTIEKKQAYRVREITEGDMIGFFVESDSLKRALVIRKLTSNESRGDLQTLICGEHLLGTEHFGTEVRRLNDDETTEFARVLITFSPSFGGSIAFHLNPSVPSFNDHTEGTIVLVGNKIRVTTNMNPDGVDSRFIELLYDDGDPLVFIQNANFNFSNTLYQFFGYRTPRSQTRYERRSPFNQSKGKKPVTKSQGQKTVPQIEDDGDDDDNEANL